MALTPDSTSPPVDRVEKGSDFAQMTKLAVTGLGGLALAVPCAYAGLAGGAVVGGILGGALGPVTSAFTSHGLAGAVGAAWSGAGTFGHYGLVLGGATALVGAAATSATAGRAAGRMLGLALEPSTSKPIDWKNWATIGTGTVLLTTGIAAGAVGGLALGSGAAAAGSIVSGVLAHGFSTAALQGAGSAALCTGLVAAPLAAFVGAQGGAAITKFVARTVIDPSTAAMQGALEKKSDASLSTQAKEALHSLGRAADSLKLDPSSARSNSATFLQGAKVGLMHFGAPALVALVAPSVGEIGGAITGAGVGVLRTKGENGPSIATGVVGGVIFGAVAASAAANTGVLGAAGVTVLGSLACGLGALQNKLRQS